MSYVLNRLFLELDNGSLCIRSEHLQQFWEVILTDF